MIIEGAKDPSKGFARRQKLINKFLESKKKLDDELEQRLKEASQISETALAITLYLHEMSILSNLYRRDEDIIISLTLS